MAQADSNLDHDIPLLPLPAHWAKSVVGLLSFICFANSYNGDFVFDDSEAIINNKVGVFPVVGLTRSGLVNNRSPSNLS